MVICYIILSYFVLFCQHMSTLRVSPEHYMSIIIHIPHIPHKATQPTTEPKGAIHIAMLGKDCENDMERVERLRSLGCGQWGVYISNNIIM